MSRHEPKPYLVGHQEFAALYRVDPKQVAQWLAPSRGVLDPETSIVVSGVRYWPLGFAARWGATTARFRQVDLDVKARIIAEQGKGWEADLGDELPPIVGQQEVIELFHLPAQGNLATTIATGRFPEHDWLLSGSMLWMLDTVLEAVPQLRESARSLPWDVDEDVAAALRDGTYDGPGSRVLTRGRHARKAL
ncbi:MULTISPECIES: hypothetical protein [unclassified Streptomyces]|uniref:hypothetical protein n=1 Tax=unclassified Streptomyces TaxID=2593676 RepID=UPI0033FBC2B3